ncbi:hypothetical protein GCM10010346_61960 [Streptomyces chryseus]|uniref:Uncharacterized protein n=1 Tax=Streptomyces chryseus TaxID=68186 RepID=A0ABQ3E905_9ACTN|nr:hypothetical protein GCM10010346_61960 [Streptomyces chryseus]
MDLGFGKGGAVGAAALAHLGLVEDVHRGALARGDVGEAHPTDEEPAVGVLDGGGGPDGDRAAGRRSDGAGRESRSGEDGVDVQLVHTERLRERAQCRFCQRDPGLSRSQDGPQPGGSGEGDGGPAADGI